MKARIRFSKFGAMKFIGHLDVMRYFQKALRRADIPVKYSEGYSPHQLISFAAPLGVGLTSDSEYVDLQLTKDVDCAKCMEDLNNAMSDGFVVTDFKVLSDDSKNAMSIVAASDYKLYLKEGYDLGLDKETFEEKFNTFYNQEEINIIKKTKKSEKEVNIKPMIYSISFDKEDVLNVNLKLAAGSVENLKPDLVFNAFCQYANIEYNPFAMQIHRAEVYANAGTEENKNLVSLNEFGTI